MIIRRLLALLFAILAIAVLGSVPFLLRTHLRETSRHSLGGVANGTVLALEPHDGAFTMVVEFRLSPSTSPRRFRAPAETIGFLLRRPRQQPGDPVLVAYDPSDPSVARVFSIRSVWSSLIRRVFASLLLLIASFLFFRTPKANRLAPAGQPPA